MAIRREIYQKGRARFVDGDDLEPAIEWLEDTARMWMKSAGLEGTVGKNIQHYLKELRTALVEKNAFAAAFYMHEATLDIGGQLMVMMDSHGIERSRQRSRQQRRSAAAKKRPGRRERIPSLEELEKAYAELLKDQPGLGQPAYDKLVAKHYGKNSGKTARRWMQIKKGEKRDT